MDLLGEDFSGLQMGGTAPTQPPVGGGGPMSDLFSLAGGLSSGMHTLPKQVACLLVYKGWEAGREKTRGCLESP